MAPNRSEQGVAATYGSLSLPPSAEKKSAGWKLYVLAGAFGAIALVALFATVGQTGKQEVATTEDDIRVLQARAAGAANRPSTFVTSVDFTDPFPGQTEGTPTQWTPDWGSKDKYDSPTAFGGKWLVHDSTSGQSNDGMAPDVKESSASVAPDSWRTGYKWASRASEVSNDGWGPCYPACGYSIQFREVVCIRSDHTVVDGGECANKKMPKMIRQCFNYSECHPCWEVDEWSDCERNAEGGGSGTVESKKTRDVRCSLCETKAGGSSSNRNIGGKLDPWNIQSPMNEIGFRSWEYDEAVKGGVRGGHYQVSTTTFAELVKDKSGLENEDVCVYGGVGICDRSAYKQLHKEGKLNVDTYFCGFDYEVNTDAKGAIPNANAGPSSGGCSMEESIRRGYMCKKGPGCTDGGNYNLAQNPMYKNIRRRERGLNCNVKPVAWSNMVLSQASHKFVYNKPYGPRDRYANNGKNQMYQGLMYWEMGPFKTVADASNPDGKGGKPWDTTGNKAPLPLQRDDPFMKDGTLLSKKGIAPQGRAPGFSSLVPMKKDKCINFCDVKYEWSVFENAPKVFPRQFACMNGTYVADGEVHTGCLKIEDAEGKITMRPPDIQQPHNTHMFCGVGLNVKPHRCCRIVKYGVCETHSPGSPKIGGCYSDGSIHYPESHLGTVAMTKEMTGTDHSKVHPHSYCGLTKQQQTNNLASRVENMVNVPHVRRLRCENKKKVYECQSQPNSGNPDWPNEEPCVEPLQIVDGVVVKTELNEECKKAYEGGRLHETASKFEKAWHSQDKGLPRRATYVECTHENCAWGSDGAIGSDKDAKGPQMDTSGSAVGVNGRFHHVILVSWIDKYGESCLPKDGSATEGEENPNEGAGFSNFACTEDLLAETCEELPCFANCTSVWVCNGWGTCNEKSMERVTNRTQWGYCQPRFFEWMPVDGPIIKTKSKDGSQATCSPTALETVESEREECEAGCDLISFQCRQCWCMRFLTGWKNDRWTATQEYNAVIDATGRSCYNAYVGRGTVQPSILRQCRGHACPGIWTADRCFSHTACPAKCAQTHQFRSVFCANRYSHMEEPESLCISNPVGSDWEMIMSMDAEGPSTFWFGAHKYWEEPHLLKANCKSVRENRKLHAFNSKKFDQMKVCFGFGFTMENSDFEETRLNPNYAAVSTIDHMPSMKEFQQRTGWYSTDARRTKVAENNRMLSIYISDPQDVKTTAPSGEHYIGLANLFIQQKIKGLRRGLKTTIKFKARSCTDTVEGYTNLASLKVELFNNVKTEWSVEKIPDSHWSTYEFSFVPPVQQPEAEIKFSATNKVFLDNIQVLSDGFKLVGYEAKDISRKNQAPLTIFNVQKRDQTDVYNGRGYRANMVGRKGPGPEKEKHWDEMLIVAGGSDHDILDFANPKLRWYQFRPKKDPYTLSVNTKASVFALANLKTSDMALQNAVVEDGGAVMCVASAYAMTFSSWSLNGVKEKAHIEEGSGDAGGCYHRAVKPVAEGETPPPPKAPRGVYYSPTRGFTKFVTRYDQIKAVSTDSVYDAPALRVFVRSSTMHDSSEEVHTNCIKYDFDQVMWRDALALFKSGEIAVGNSDFEPFSEIAFEEAYGARRAGKKCPANRMGFNLNIGNWKCKPGKIHPTYATLQGKQTYARMGFLVDPHNAKGNECEEPAKLDGAIGLGLFGSTNLGPKKANSGFTDTYAELPAGTTREWQQKNSWVWVADTSQNPAVEGVLTFDKRNHNKQGYIVLDGASNVFAVPDQCKQKCKELKACKVGFFVEEAPGSNEQKGQCWLASEFANSTEVAKSEICDPEKGWRCNAFEKKALLNRVDSNAYVYTEHMVLPGYGNWDLNKQFATGTVFEIHENEDKFSPIILGPLTVSRVISKQFSYGKQTYVYWEGDFKNFDTMRSKVVFTHRRSTDSLEMYGLPGKVVGCSFYKKEHAPGSFESYSSGLRRPPRSGRTAEATCNELNKKQDACHGFSCWKNPNLVANGGFEETESQEEEATMVDDGMPGWEVSTSLVNDKAHFDSMVIDVETEQNERIRGPMPFVCEECLRYVHLVPGRTIKTTFNTQPGLEYIVSFFYSGKICGGTNPKCNVIKQAQVIYSFPTQDFCKKEKRLNAQSRGYTATCDNKGRHTKLLAVNVKGWGGYQDVYEAADPKSAPKPYRWKHVLYEVEARYMVSQLEFKDRSQTGLGKSGIILDEVNVQLAHPGHLGDNAEKDNYDHTECATYCTDELAKAGACDFTVLSVQQETVEFKNSKVDKDWFAETVCMNMDGTRMDAVLCEKHAQGYAGVLLSTATGGGRQHYYKKEQSVKSVFGGVAQVVSTFPGEARGCENCSPDEYGPWKGVSTYFAPAPSITIFTYKIEFTNGVTSILNIEVTGQNFFGSVFKLLSRAKTVLSLREINYVVEGNKAKSGRAFQSSAIVNRGDEAGKFGGTSVRGTDKLPAQNFAFECPAKGACTVIVAGTPIYEDTVYYFEEAGNTYQGTQKNDMRRRDRICIRTPVCELFGNQHFATYDVQNHKAYEKAQSCSDGIRKRLDCADPDFFTNFEATKCTHVHAGKSGQEYGIQRMSANGAFRFSYQADIAYTREAATAAGKPKTCFRFGMYEYVQPHGFDITDHDRVALDAQRNKDATLRVDYLDEFAEAEEEDTCANPKLIEPSYHIEVCRDVVARTQTIKLIDEGKRVKKTETPEVTIALEDVVAGGATRKHFFWADMYKEQGNDGLTRSFVRFGMDVPSKAVQTGYNIKDVTIGGDVLLVFEVPKGQDVLKVSHSSVTTDHPAKFEVCSDAYRHGRMPSDRVCEDVGHCACAWHYRKRWDEKRCDAQCGFGKKRRLVYCRMDEHMKNTVDCGRNMGDDCIYHIKSSPHCKIQFFEKTGLRSTSNKYRSLIPIERHPSKHAKLGYDVRNGASILYPSGASATKLLREDKKSSFSLANVGAISIEGQGCSLLFSDTPNPRDGNVVMRISVPATKDVAIMGIFSGSELNGIPQLYKAPVPPATCSDELVGFRQSCKCDTGCAISEALPADKAMDTFEKETHTIFYHKPFFPGFASFLVAKFNTKSCSKTERPIDEIECLETHGCCLTCAYGDWHCGEENCMGYDGENNCGPPQKWNWKSIGQLKEKYKTWSAYGGCSSQCGGGYMYTDSRRVTCETQQWTCDEWVAEQDKGILDNYYIPRQDIEQWLDKTEMYQRTLYGPEKFDKMVGTSKGSQRPICRKKKLVRHANRLEKKQLMKTRFNAESVVPGPYLRADVCGQRKAINDPNGKVWESTLDECLAEFGRPLNVYQYTEGCPETCAQEHWKHLRFPRHAKGRGCLIGKEYRIDDSVDVTDYTVGKDTLTSRIDFANKACGDKAKACIQGKSLARVCNPAQMWGSAHSNIVLSKCQMKAHTKKANAHLVRFSHDLGYTARTGAFAKWTGKAPPGSTAIDEPSKVRCIAEHRTLDGAIRGENPRPPLTSTNGREYCTCEWRKTDPAWKACSGCGDVIQWRIPSKNRDWDPDQDGVWCVKQDCGSTSKENQFNDVVIPCPLERLEKNGCCCGRQQGAHKRMGGGNYQYSGCCIGQRPLSKKHCVAFDKCSYQWHVRTNTAECDTFVQCVPLEAWKADARHAKSEDKQREWCTSGPQRHTTHDDFITYGLGGCWLPDTLHANPNFATAIQAGGGTKVDGVSYSECVCYYGGTDFIGDAELSRGQAPIDTARDGDGYCSPVMVEGAMKVGAIHIAVGGSGRTESSTLKGAIYTDGGSVVGAAGLAVPRGQPGHRVAVTTEHSVTTKKKIWVELRFPLGSRGRSAPMFSTGNAHGMVDISGGRYWLCVFSSDRITLHKLGQPLRMDGTPNNKAVTMRKVDKTNGDGRYEKNSVAYPALLLADTVQSSSGGTFSIYASTGPQTNNVYRDAKVSTCGSAKTCEDCLKIAGIKTGRPCDWVREKGKPRCYNRKKAQDRGLKRINSCKSKWASGLYMRLGGNWGCSTKGKEITLKSILDQWPKSKTYRPTENACAEACYFANMRWAGWTGVYDLGMGFSMQTAASISTGHKYPIKKEHKPFYCEGFTKKGREKCSFLRSGHVTAVARGLGGGARCFITLDNPNPCALGASNKKKWAKSSKGHWYFVTNEFGMMEYVEVGPNGPSKCGTSKTVFATASWKGKSGNTFKPDPQTSCTDETCERCVDHMLGKSMVRGMLPHDNLSGKAANCKLVTAARVVTKCDQEPLKMSCPSGERVVITDAKYGRQTGATICQSSPDKRKIVPSEASMDAYKQCWADVTSSIEGACAGKHNCKVTPTSEYSANVFCKDLFGYLRVEYTCTTVKSSAK